MKISRKLDKVIAEILKTGKAPGYEITRLERYGDQASLCLKDKDSNYLNILMGNKTIRVDGVLFDYPMFSRIQIVLGHGVVGRFFARVERNRKDRAKGMAVMNNLNRFFNK